MATQQAHSSSPTSPFEEVPCCADAMQSEEVVMDCLAMLAASIHLDTAIDSFLETLGCFYNASKVFLFRDEESVSPAVSCAFSWPFSGSSAEKVPAEWFAPWFDALEFEGMLTLSAGDSRLAPLQFFCGAQPEDAVVVPLYTNTSLTGFLCVVHPTQHKADWKVLHAVACLCVVELQKLNLVKEIEYLHQKDPLTDVYNRSSYISALAKSSYPAPESMGVVLVGVKDLKKINSVLGNAFGDSVVQQTAEIMKASLNCDIYRIGGNEFLSLHSSLSSESFQSMVSALRASFADDETYHVSVGTAWTDHDVDVFELISLAEQQLSASKKSAHGQPNS